MNDPDKVQFIICANDARKLEECRFYIERLHIPEGVKTEITIIDHAVSMASGYNFGMRQSDAKYRIYLHQDTCLIFSDMLKELIRIFEQNTSVGMLGVVGAKKIPEDAMVHSAWDTGRVDTNSKPLELNYQMNKERQELTVVEAVDGLFMATQYDVPWREDLFFKWDFYDISQSLEMKRRGYQTAVPFQIQPWCWHDNETSKMADYEGERKIFAREYQDFRAFKRETVYQYQNSQNQLLEEFQEEIMHMVDCGNLDQAGQLLEQYHRWLGSMAQLICLENICYIRQIEKNAGNQPPFYGDGMKGKELLRNFWEDKFLVKRAEYDDDDATEQLLRKCCQGKISETAVFGVAVCYAKNKEKVTAQWNRAKSKGLEKAE